MQHDQRVNILLVDDRPENLLALEVVLESLGQRLVRAHSGAEALRCMLQEEFALVLLDVQMPDMDGFETAELIRSRERSQHIPIIFITANNTSNAHVFQGYALGAVDYLFKPIVPEVLRSKVGVFVELFKKSDEVQRQANQLKHMHAELEVRVDERTAGLAETNAALQNQILERKRAEESLKFLAEASRLLSASLDIERNLISVAHLAIPYMADCCAVDLYEDGAIRRLDVAAHDPNQAALLQQGLMDLSQAVMKTGHAVLFMNLGDQALLAMLDDKTQIALMRVVGIASIMVVPLMARERSLGAFIFMVSNEQRRYSPANLQIAEDLARRAAVTIDNARLYQEAKAAVEARDAFLSVAAHELKTPLTSLLGYADLLQRRAARTDTLSERDFKALQLISEQGRRLTKMISSLLDLSRIQTGQLSIERAAVDLDALAERIVAEAQPTLEQHTLRLMPYGSPLVIEGDELRLEQVLQNLLQNAVKYSPAGGTISLEVSSQGDQGCIAIRDQGIGIPAQSLPQLFSRFYRAHNVKEQHVSGLGVGLYVVREIVTLHGGTVDVYSQEGEGSVFTISLPLVKTEIMSNG